VELLQTLKKLELPWAIGTSGRMVTAEPNIRSLGLDPSKITMVTRDQVNYAKPDPDLFVEAARRLETSTQGSYVIGDSIWDMLAAARCGALGIGLFVRRLWARGAHGCRGVARLRRPGGHAGASRRDRSANPGLERPAIDRRIELPVAPHSLDVGKRSAAVEKPRQLLVRNLAIALVRNGADDQVVWLSVQRG